ncbi:MAG: glucose-6-phosphate dehydrogenase [Bifidobacteriaceae bacterium]|jgi:glucose-6-phosphate 1-dehydrogenase|nr:glucose-6-phosphate dehydrogenase [Bifidobacteriaceae bacterium]
MSQGSSNPLVDPLDRRLTLIPPPCALVLFGATGDLARRMILPAVYDLANRGLLPAGFSLTGVGRSEWTKEHFVRQAHAAVASGARTPFRQRVFEQLTAEMAYVSGDVADLDTCHQLARVLDGSGRGRRVNGGRVFYLATPPATFEAICANLAASGLASGERSGSGERSASGAKVVVEKPFGRDLESARELSRALGLAFAPADVYRIDHFLGGQTARSLLALRFANRLFEPLWNSEHVDHVQITMAEALGVGARAGYYDSVGAARDVMQNHLLQLLALTAMDQPASFGADDLRAAKEAALDATRLPGPAAQCAARGVYASGWLGNVPARGYLEEDGVPADSTTETYAALKLEVTTDRWRGTPFYLRTGKRLARRVTEVAIVFKPAAAETHRGLDTGCLGSNTLVMRIQPDQGTTLRFGAKAPQTPAEVRDVTLDLAHGHAFTEALPEAYEQLILDVMLGADPLFPREREVEAAWRVVDEVESHWATLGTGPEPYPAGTWGPCGAEELARRDGREWMRP